VRALAIVDGEHYPSVVRDALAELSHEVVAAVLVGGSEKLRGGESYGVPLAHDLLAAIEQYDPEIVVDLSDEPVLGPVERFALASQVLSRGLTYEGADFRFDPPERRPFELPSISVVGTGKRVGKTAVTGHVARLLARDRRVVVVAMGRGGPRDPETIVVPPTVEALVELSRSGRHAASDHLETAALVGVETVGCRRCGGGLAGGVVSSNVHDGARVAVELRPDLVVFDGSGAALPPVATDRTITVVGAHQNPAVAGGYLNAFRLLLADLVVVTMAEPGTGWAAIVDALRAVVPETEIVATTLRPRPATDVRGRRIAYFCTAPTSAHAVLADHLAEEHGAEVVHVSGNLSNREALRAELDSIDADVFVVELKAAAVDVVAEAALGRGAEVILAGNEIRPGPGQPDLDELVLEMARIRV
jgi:cyclic 2,3-diphosphoglycerate synthetase